METEYPISSLEKLFVELNEVVFGYDDEWFGSGLSHSIFTPAMTMWLMMLQAIHKKSLKGVIELLEDGAGDLVFSYNKKSKKRIKEISKNTGGYSQARKRLDVKAVEDFLEALIRRLIPQIGTNDTYCMDGSILTLYKSNDIESHYPLHRNNRGGSLPQMRIVFATDASSGVCALPVFGPETVSEQTLCLRVMESLPKHATLIADANFGIFYVVYKAVSYSLTPVFRLTAQRTKSLLKKTSLPSEGEFDVEWTPSKDELRKYPELKDAKAIKGKVVITTIKYKGYDPIQISIFTTSGMSKQEIIDKYEERHKIELDIRQLKVTLETDFLSARSKDMVEKELLIRVAAHNLLRDVIREATAQVGLKPREVSFTAVVGTLKVLSKKIQAASNDTERLEYWNRFLKAITQHRIYKRKKRRPTYPRKVRRNLRRFPINRD